MPWRLKTRTSTTVPDTPGGRRSDVSRTSEAFSPKMARSSFSSGVIGLSPFGVILPTMMSPGCRSEEHTSELQSLMRISYAVFCFQTKFFFSSFFFLLFFFFFFFFLFFFFFSFFSFFFFFFFFFFF